MPVPGSVFIYSDVFASGGFSTTQSPYGIHPPTGTTNKQVDISITIPRPDPTQYWDKLVFPVSYLENNFVYTPSDGFGPFTGGNLYSTLIFNSASSHILSYPAGGGVSVDFFSQNNPDPASEKSFHFYGNGAPSTAVPLSDNVRVNGGVITDSVTFTSFGYQAGSEILAGTFSGTLTRVMITAKLVQETIQASFGYQANGIYAGQTATLAVQGDYIQTISVDQGIGAVSNTQKSYPKLLGSVQVSPTVTTTYTVTGHGLALQDVTTTITLIVFNTPPAPAPSVPGMNLTLDAHRRPALCGVASGSVTGYVSRDAGHTYLPTTIAANGKDASLLIDTRQNRFRVVYSTGTSGLMLATGLLGDAFTQDAGSPSALKTPAGALLSGVFPVACPHPTDKDYVLLVYAAGTNLTAAYSIDAGGSWNVAAASVATADLTTSGRPALAFSGNSASMVYGSGNSLYAALSKDRGMTWQPPTIAAGSGPYQSLSLLASQGRLYLLAFAGTTPAPVLLVSPDLGATWAQVSSTFPAITPPSGIGVVPSTGTLRLGLTHTSSDDGRTWIAA